MKHWTVILTMVVAAGCATAPGPPAPSASSAPSGPAAVGTLPAELEAIKTYTYGQSRAGILVVEAMVRDALVDTPERSAEMADQLASLLGKDTTADCKQFVCRQLYFIGTENQVPALAPLLVSDDTSDMARYALEAVPGAKVDAALLAALDNAPKASKIGIVNSLGVRRTNSARTALRELTRGNDPDLAAAAEAALGKIGK